MAIGVLIVEDEFLLRADAAEFMENSGFTVYEASNADEAIALLERHVDIRVRTEVGQCQASQVHPSRLAAGTDFSPPT